MHIGIFVLCLLITVAIAVNNNPINYCGARMCEGSDKHTFCQYRSGPSSHCTGYISTDITSEEKSKVVARLNRRRNEAAAGMLHGFPSAGNMLKMRWVEELAHEAQLWADQCIPPSMPETHDECRDLYSVSVGQCVASVVGEAPGLRVESLVDIWYMQSMYYKGNVSMYMLPNFNGSYYGDFAQMMWAKSYMVGCGRSRFMINIQNRFRTVERLVCNIAPAGPSPGHSLWATSPPASLCPTHSNPDSSYNFLCDIQKSLIVLNTIPPSLTPEEHMLMYTVLNTETLDNTSTPGAFDLVYLKRLAMATLGINGTTERILYFSMPSKDIIETIDLEEKTSTTNNVIYWQVEDVTQDSTTSTLRTSVNPNTTQSITSLQTTVTVDAKQRISFIGRPKTYNLAELTSTEYNTENYALAEELKDPNDIYIEYEFVETPEDSPATQTYTSTTKLHSTSKSSNVMNVKMVTKLDKDNSTRVTTKFYTNSSTVYETPKNNIKVNNNGSNIQVHNKTLTHETNVPKGSKDDIDEYFQDPETVRELQEALERMEREISMSDQMETGYRHERNERKDRSKVRALANRRFSSCPPMCLLEVDVNDDADGGRRINSPSTTSTVRRELRDTSTSPPEILGNDISQNDEMNDYLERNKSSAIYNMMMKYMPYLKQYGPEPMQSREASGANRLISSYPLVLLLCNF